MNNGKGNSAVSMLIAALLALAVLGAEFVVFFVQPGLLRNGEAVAVNTAVDSEEAKASAEEKKAADEEYTPGAADEGKDTAASDEGGKEREESDKTEETDEIDKTDEEEPKPIEADEKEKNDEDDGVKGRAVGERKDAEVDISSLERPEGFDEFVICEDEEFSVDEDSEFDVSVVYCIPADMTADGKKISASDYDMLMIMDIYFMDNEFGYEFGDMPSVYAEYEITDQDTGDVSDSGILYYADFDGENLYASNVKLPDGGTYTLKVKLYNADADKEWESTEFEINDWEYDGPPT